ncbi:MAG: DNA repair protein RecO [Desulfobulbaceae bacterium]|nr:DNA repair protein RecO [Desulfobulbaceae bacterium]HIJ79419.1 DNA repair protein RecO [Deltaproteobacteria bacterium]
MLLKQAPAVIVQVKDHGDSDKIVTLYTLDEGKISAIAKGAKRSKKRFVNKLELFSLLNVSYAPGRTTSLARLDQAELITNYPSLHQNYGQYVAASLLCELVLFWTREHDREDELFQLLTWALEGLAMGVTSAQLIIFFHVKMLEILGFRPLLNGCGNCGTLAPQAAPYRFSPMRNGLICGQCEHAPSGPGLEVSMQTIQLLRKVQELDICKLPRLHFSKAAILESIALLKRYDSHLLQRELQSWNYLQQLL